MRSASERDAAMIDPEVQAVTRRIADIARPNPHAYTVARSFVAPEHKRPAA